MAVKDELKVFDSFHLKVIAVLSMMIDHTGAVLFPHIFIFRYIGRISFPIYCFLLVEGFFHTRDVKKYMKRMAVFAIISEIPYDLAFYKTIFEIRHQNVFITLLLGLATLYFIEKTSAETEKLAVVMISLFLCEITCCDYGSRGLLLILIFYFCRERKGIAVLMASFWNLLWTNVISVQIYGAFSSIPILLYNGKPGRKMKYFFYFFYPLHLIILYLIWRLR